MSVFVIGGTGFIGRRLVPLLAAARRGSRLHGHQPADRDYADLGKQVRVVRGDVSQFDDVMAATIEAKPTGWSTSPISSAATCRRTSRSSSTSSAWTIASRRRGCRRQPGRLRQLAGGQRRAEHFYGERIVNEDDFRHGHVQYAMHKIFNEWQAQDYREKHGMEITAIRPANVTGPDKIFGSVDHVFMRHQAGARRAGHLAVQGRDARPVHVDEIAEIFARVVMKDKPEHAVYNTGGQTISLGEIADIVREFLPDAQITFDNETGGRELSAAIS